MAATESSLCPSPIAVADTVVPACMFAPDRGSDDDPSGGDCYEDGEAHNGESEGHLDLTSKVGLCLSYVDVDPQSSVIVHVTFMLQIYY